MENGFYLSLIDMYFVIFLVLVVCDFVYLINDEIVFATLFV